MGQIEQKSKERMRRNNLRKYVLSAVALSGGLAVAVVAPNVLQLLGSKGLSVVPRQGELITRTRKRLTKLGLLSFRSGSIYLTEKGERALRDFERAEYQIKKPRRWDGRWRILTFDIPEKRKVLRDKVRQTLVAVGFVKLQNSVWIYPYDCEDLIVLLKADFRIGKDMLYVIADSIEGDWVYRKHFQLPGIEDR